MPLLENGGRNIAISIDLPGLGDDKTPVDEITLKRYVDAVCEALQNETDPVVLVGHSMGGIIISEVSERMPEMVRALIYLTAYLLRSGESLIGVVEADEEARKLVQHVDFDPPVCTVKRR